MDKHLRLRLFLYSKSFTLSSTSNINYVINMKKAVIIGVMCTILLANSMASIQAYDTYEKGTTPIQTLSYTAVVGDENIYNIYYDVTAEYENEAVTDDISDWAAGSITAGEYFESINENFQIKLDVTQANAEWVNASWTGGDSYHDEYDLFNASIRTREVVEDEEDGEWIVPTNLDKVYDVADFALNSFGSVNGTNFQTTFENVTDSVDLSESGNTYDNVEIQRIQTVAMVNDTLVAQQSFNLLDFKQTIFFKPAEYDFKEWLTYLEDSTSLSAIDFDQMTEDDGITALRANTNGIGIAFTTDTFSYTFIEEMTGIDFNSTTSAVPTSEFETQVHMALEYDEDGLLADIVIYYDFSAVVDASSERFHVYLTTSIYHEDYSMVEKDQIEDGSVGDRRNLTGFNCPFLNSLPGYPVGVVSLLALVSVAGLILKFKRK